MGAIVLFVLAKLAAYCIFCAQAPRWFEFPEPNLRSFGLRWGASRLLIGIAAGFPIVFIFATTLDSGWPFALSYAVSFVPARYVEWFALFILMARSRTLTFGVRANTWMMMGVALSVAFDFVFFWTVAAGNVNLKFVC